MAITYHRVPHFRTPERFAEHLAELAPSMPFDFQVLSAAENSPLAAPIQVGRFTVGNRWCIHPMEGWDAEDDGRPSEHVVRRWRHFGDSGAKLIWGGEAFAVRRDGRANPHQLYYSPANVEPMRHLLGGLVTAHTERFGSSATDNLLVGLQLTHSGRFCRPNRHDKPEPRIAYHHPVLDVKFGIDPNDDSVVLSDDEIKRLIDEYIVAASMARDIGENLIRMIDACREEILIQNAYVVLDEAAEAALRRASARGVKIYLCTNSGESTNHPSTVAYFLTDWKRLLATMPTARILVYPKGMPCIHTKAFVFDRQIAVVGTYNLDPLSMVINSEVVTVVNYQPFARRLALRMEKDFAKCLEYKIRKETDGRITVIFGPEAHTEAEVMKKLERFGKMKFLRPLI